MRIHGGNRRKITSRLSALILLPAIVFLLFSSCPNAAFKEYSYRAGVYVSGAVAGGLDIDIVESVSGGTSAAAVTTFPWSFEFGGDIDVQTPPTVQFEVSTTTNLAPGESFTVEIRYVEDQLVDTVSRTLYKETAENSGAAGLPATIQGAAALY